MNNPRYNEIDARRFEEPDEHHEHRYIFDHYEGEQLTWDAFSLATKILSREWWLEILCSPVWDTAEFTREEIAKRISAAENLSESSGYLIAASYDFSRDNEEQDTKLTVEDINLPESHKVWITVLDVVKREETGIGCTYAYHRQSVGVDFDPEDLVSKAGKDDESFIAEFEEIVDHLTKYTYLDDIDAISILESCFSNGYYTSTEDGRVTLTEWASEASVLDSSEYDSISFLFVTRPSKPQDEEWRELVKQSRFVQDTE